MAFLTGLLLVDAPASALNNAGQKRGSQVDNAIEVKQIRTREGIFPYVSAQAFRFWLRETLVELAKVGEAVKALGGQGKNEFARGVCNS